jgi:hypothetical protein
MQAGARGVGVAAICSEVGAGVTGTGEPVWDAAG